MPLTCESIHAGFITQPVNSWSSIAFIAVGLIVAIRSRHHRGNEVELLILSGILVAEGIASFIFHGPAPADLRWLDFAASVSAPLFIAAHDVGLVRGWDIRRRVTVFLASAVTAMAALWVGAPVVVLGSIAAVGAIAGEVAAFRGGYRPAQRGAPPSVSRTWYLAVLLLGIAGVFYLLGTSWSPACNPDGLWQFHALWHVLSAAALGLYAYAALEHDPPPAPRPLDFPEAQG